MDAGVGPLCLPPPSCPSVSLGEAAADEDPAQGVLLAAHCHGWADVQVAEGVEAGGTSEWDFPGYVSKVRTQDLLIGKVLQASVSGGVKDHWEVFVRGLHVAKFYLVLDPAVISIFNPRADDQLAVGFQCQVRYVPQKFLI